MPKTVQDIMNLIRENGRADNMTMVGDTKFDLIGAEKMGLDAIGVTYGFGSKEELSAYPHIALIDNFSHIVNLL